MDVNEVLETYSKKIQEEIGNPSEPNSDLSKVSKDYESFKKDMMPELSKYERRAKFLGSIITVRLSLKDEAKIRRHLEIAHLTAPPGEVAGFSISSFIPFFIFICDINSRIFSCILFLFNALAACNKMEVKGKQPDGPGNIIYCYLYETYK